MRRKSVTIISLRTAIIGLLGVAILAGGLWTWLGKGSQTRIEIYDPTGFTATEEVTGSCFTGSIAAQRAGAFRCSAGNSLFDPCFSQDGSVACPVGDPGRNEGIRIQLSSPLPQPPEAWENEPDVSNPQPWYLALDGGGVCGVLTGTRPSPDFPLGCSIPSVDAPPYCSEPILLEQSDGTYITVCGIFDPDTREIINRKAYVVKEMWL
jgi:hypothetical protein